MAKTVAWGFMALLASAIGAYALSYFYFPDMIDPEFKKRFDAIPLSARLHIIPGGLALILGAFQFHSGLRKRWMNIHRNYCCLVLLNPQSDYRRMVFQSDPAAPADKNNMTSNHRQVEELSTNPRSFRTRLYAYSERYASRTQRNRFNMTNRYTVFFNIDGFRRAGFSSTLDISAPVRSTNCPAPPP